MTAITRIDRATEKQLTAALAKRLGNMELATQVTKAAITQMGGVHRDAIREVSSTVKTADSLVRAARVAGQMTPSKEMEIDRLTAKYLDRVLKITHDAGLEMIDKMLR